MACGASTDRLRAVPSYRFRGARGTLSWPREDGLGLGACGIWNFLWRLGFHPLEASPDTLPAPTGGDVLFVQLDEVPNAAAVAAVRRWVEDAGSVIGSGLPEAWPHVSADRTAYWRSARPENPYAALGYVHEDASVALIAPPRWTFGRLESPLHHSRVIGALATIGGERQTPSRATVRPIPGAPAMLLEGRCAYLNGNPFAAFQAWLQAQEDLLPWMAWRPRLFWLDHWVSTLADLLIQSGVFSLDVARPGIPGLGAITVVLRHDLDYSRDTTYLEEEIRRGLAATYAVLDDRNATFWVKRLAAAPAQETAFHYSAGVRDVPRTLRRYVKGERRGAWKAWKSGIAGRGLERQVTRARSKGIGVSTLHRHLPYIIYPELIDALDAVHASHDDVLGSSSLYRAQVQRWNSDRVDAFGGAIGEWPDSQFPLWLPFRVAHAAGGGRRLRGWESTSVMETEPELAAQMLDFQVPHLPQRVITLGFHPAHANTSTFVAEGSGRQFNEVLSLIAARHIDVRPLSEVYRLASQAAA